MSTSANSMTINGMPLWEVDEETLAEGACGYVRVIDMRLT